jgi:hypothetical protein
VWREDGVASVTRFYFGVGHGAAIILCAASVNKGYAAAAVASFLAAVAFRWAAGRVKA